MPSTDQLLQELIDLQKEEMRRSLRDRRLRFYFGTLPAFILLVLSIVSLWGLYEIAKEAIDQLSNYDLSNLPSVGSL